MKCFRRFALQILCPASPALSLCFRSFSRCDWFVASSHDFDEKKQLDHESTYILLNVLLCSIAEYFYELCRILTSP